MRRRTKFSRRLESTVFYRGREREVILEVDRERGTIAIRLHGCQTRRTFYATDLWRPTSPQLALPL